MNGEQHVLRRLEREVEGLEESRAQRDAGRAEHPPRCWREPSKQEGDRGAAQPLQVGNGCRGGRIDGAHAAEVED